MLRARNCRLVAVMDPVGVDRVARAFKVASAYGSEEDLLSDPEVEAVYIASPAHCHARQIEAAARAGKHILCEKPLTLSLREGRAAALAARKHEVFLQEGYMMKFHGAHARIKDLIDEGRLGKIVYMRAQLSCWYPKIKGAWRQDPRTGGGGALIDMATHLYDLLEHFAGPARRVAALTGRLVQGYKSEDASTTLLEFESGAHATVDCFFCVPDEASRTRLEIYGSQGALLAEGTIGQSQGGALEGIFGLGDAPYDARQDKDVKRTFRPVPFPKVNPYTAECEHFADAILRGRPPELNGPENALRILKLMEKAYESARKGKMIRV
jgi:predicted dehydrogenase